MIMHSSITRFSWEQMELRALFQLVFVIYPMIGKPILRINMEKCMLWLWVTLGRRNLVVEGLVGLFPTWWLFLIMEKLKNHSSPALHSYSCSVQGSSEWPSLDRGWLTGRRCSSQQLSLRTLSFPGCLHYAQGSRQDIHAFLWLLT